MTNHLFFLANCFIQLTSLIEPPFHLSIDKRKSADSRKNPVDFPMLRTDQTPNNNHNNVMSFIKQENDEI